MSERLDHAVISVRDDMDRAETIFRRMGFTLTPRGFHAAGSCNHLMVFERDYLELIGFPPAGQTIRPDLRDAPIGLDGLVLATDDARGVYERLRPAFPIGEPQRLTRMVHLDGASEEARFTTVRLPREALAGGRVYFCQHETPHLVWNKAWLGHGNGARAIEGFTIVVPDPAATAASYAKVLDSLAIRRDDESITMSMQQATLELTTAASLKRRFGALTGAARDAQGKPRAAYMAMVTISVADISQTKAVLDEGGFGAIALDADTVAVPAHAAMDCIIAFRRTGKS